jgi:hypothetical protein
MTTTEEIKTEEIKTEEIKTEEIKTEEQKATETPPTQVSPPKSYATYPGVFYIDPVSNKMERSYPTKLLETKSYVAKSPIHGMGCFAKQDIQMGELIEECLAIITDTTTKSNKDFVINNYLYTWPCEYQDAICDNNGPTYFVPSGNSLIYNHSDTPNAYWIFDKAMKRIFMGALRNIKEGEEITWYYGHGYAHRLRTQKNPTDQKPNGCGTCAARKKQLEEMNRLKQNTTSQEEIEKMKTKLLENVQKEKQVPEQVNNTENIIANDPRNDPVFRSMIVPENILNDSPLT